MATCEARLVADGATDRYAHDGGPHGALVRNRTNYLTCRPSARPLTCCDRTTSASSPSARICHHRCAGWAADPAASASPRREPSLLASSRPILATAKRCRRCSPHGPVSAALRDLSEQTAINLDRFAGGQVVDVVGHIARSCRSTVTSASGVLDMSRASWNLW